ncbi:hypothetical protein [Goodfellowiella coeruleoviolacea]|uniref:Uncharacterized protein n=1 Tax=Goodfellowiella coeruleoviolacea TaxID=334858 RepID=A0AAE3KI75_9PSEU|nr:hypothetical protein [Goodfellowiella coeruleoviolacea]MCP2168981.1 hypothetical protein [Goodfellowiella coeruleoviolacea]
MDEVQVMTRAGESVGRALGTGLRAVRQGAVRAGHAGAEAASQVVGTAETKLADHGIVPDRLFDALSERAEEVGRSTRRARKNLARQRRQLARQRQRLIRQGRKKGERLRADVLDRADRTRDDIARLTGRAAAKATRKAARAKKVTRQQARRAARLATRKAGKLTATREIARRRRWPWLLALLVAAGAAGYAVLSRRPQEVRLHDEPAQSGGGVDSDSTAARAQDTNGQRARDNHTARRS